jgi:hypothetical protein
MVDSSGSSIKAYNSTFTWEQYDQETDEGRQSHLIDGWNEACTLLIAAEVY